MKIPELDKIKHWCQARGIDLCILFGSQATGKARPNSDVDIALFSQTNPALQKKLPVCTAQRKTSSATKLIW